MSQTPPRPVTKPATIGDVAALAGVSRSAVSRAFTPGRAVSPAMRARIVEAAEALGYRPNLIARSLSTRRSNTVAVAITRLENAFHAELLQDIAIGLQARGLQVLLFVTDPATDPDPPVEDLLRHRVDAIILSAVRLTSHYAQECRAAGVPVMVVNRAAFDPAVPAVIGDNLGGGRMVADLFARCGHRRPIYISGFPDSSTSRDRELGFAEALGAAGITPLASIDGRYDQARTQAITRDLLTGPNPPDAIFCANDHMAVAALQVARHELGLRVGDDLSIVGYDDLPVSGLADVGLTTVSQPPAEFADAAIRIIERLIADPETEATRTVIEGELILRSSSRHPQGR